MSADATVPPAEVEAALIAWLERDVQVAFPYDWHALLATVTALVAEAVWRERERCARVVDDHNHLLLPGYDIAAAIRQAPRP